MRMSDCDVLILGCGPAGAATAIELARQGFSVTLLGRLGHHQVRYETLPPDIRQPLRDLGAWESFAATQPVSSPGILSAWGSEQAVANDFVYHPDGPGWHVDRRRFDHMLCELASGCGVTRWAGNARISSLAHDGSFWKIDCAGMPADRFRARFLVDATGLRAVAARRLNRARIVVDRLVASLFVLEHDPGRDKRLLLESAPEGWWYASPTPEQRLLVGFVTDAATIRTMNRETWPESLCPPRHLSQRIGSAQLGQPQPVIAPTARRQQVAGDHWLAVGEAAMSVDPLSGRGVLRALDSARQASEAISVYFKGDRKSPQRYQDWISAQFDREIAVQADLYRQERRWASSGFWMARH